VITNLTCKIWLSEEEPMGEVMGVEKEGQPSLLTALMDTSGQKKTHI
jgi:hypothetical protein